MRALLRHFGDFFIRYLGSPIRDDETGEFLGRALIVIWRGRIHVIGFTGVGPLKLVFRSQERIRYWRQSIGFTRSGPPDFPRHLTE